MLDQLQIGNLYSYDDFEASVAQRKIGTPKRKTIKETVPFSNLTYDFSAINGEVYYEERDLEYVFEITAETPEMLEELKMNFSSWVMNTMQEKLYDPFIEDYHFLATYDDMSCDDDEGMDKSTITVKFKAYPYKIANNTKEIVIPLYAYEEATAKIKNLSSHRITPTFNTDIGVSLEIGGMIYSIPSGEVTDESFKIPSGMTEITVKNNEVITEKKSGKEIVFENSASAKFKNIVVHGKSWQNGTPTPTEPQPIESLENVEVKVLGTEEQTLTIPYVLRGIQVTNESLATYTDLSGEMWVADEVDYSRGVYVQRVKKFNLADVPKWNHQPGWENNYAFFSGGVLTDAVQVSGYVTQAHVICNRLGVSTPSSIANHAANVIGQGDGGSLYVSAEGITDADELVAYFVANETCLYYILAEPIELNLTEEDIRAYKALHSNEPTTIIISNAELEVECVVNPDTPVQVGTLNISFVEEVF